jgi:hypothetical protein
MTKPVIVKRLVKGSALTYAEHDLNFQNLADATITLTAGTGGTAVVSDLNGNITLVAGAGITLTGNNTAKTVTINGDVVNDTTPQLGGNLSVNGFKIVSEPATNGNIVLEPNGVGDVLLKADTVRVGTTIAAQIFALEGEDLVVGVLDSTPGATYGGTITVESGANGNIIIFPDGTGTIELKAPLTVNATSGTPTTFENGYYENMLVTPVSWLKITVGSSVYYLPLYQ